MFFEYIALVHLAQHVLKYYHLSDFWYISISIFEYLFRIIFIGMFLPMNFYESKLSFIKLSVIIILLLNSFNNGLDFYFNDTFGFYPFQGIFGFWIISLFIKYIINYLVSFNKVKMPDYIISPNYIVPPVYTGQNDSNDTDSNDTYSNDTDSNDTYSNDTDSNDTSSNDTDSNDTGSNDTVSNDLTNIDNSYDTDSDTDSGSIDSSNISTPESHDTN